MRFFIYLVGIAIALFGVGFAGLNAEPVKIQYYLGVSTLPLSLLLVIALGLGLLIGLLATLVMVIKLKKANYQLKNHVRLVEKEVENLRAIPLKDSH